MSENKESDRYTMAIVDLQQASLEIKGRKYLKVPDWSSDMAIHEINQAYLEQLPPSELIWHIETALSILKKKAVKIELPEEHPTAAANAI